MLAAPAVGYEKCPKHPANDIILFCLGGTCLEPLCKECCKLHVHWHNQQGTRADIDTVDNVRNNCISDIHGLKVRFEEERAILHHFGDEGDDFIVKIHKKLEKVRQSLQKMIEEYCQSLEKVIAEKIKQHRASHPGMQKELRGRLDRVVADLDQQEKSLMQPKYMRALLTVMMEEKNHDLEGFSREIDTALKAYLKNLFDVFVHEDHINELRVSLSHYVAVEPAMIEEELEVYTRKIREGKHVYGIDAQGNNGLTQQKPYGGDVGGYQQKIEANNKNMFGQADRSGKFK